ncbi:MAG: hypothetical protein HOP33_14445 [Verrucomicrobia bacterium]|nr:hypothetical protein [Verrucomicrobiota bacterium]
MRAYKIIIPAHELTVTANSKEEALELFRRDLDCLHPIIKDITKQE